MDKKQIKKICKAPDRSCHDLIVPKETCYIYFGKKRKNKYHHSFDGTTLVDDKNGRKAHIEGKILYTKRGEQFIIDFNKKGEIIGIELLSSKKCPKPCQ